MAAVNNNSSTVVVGRTSPVPAGQQVSAKSIPVVIASDQSPIPVEEQNKQQSEVALSLLGIPRSEVALGIFADVNTYDVNPSEWSAYPEQFTNSFQYSGAGLIHENLGGSEDWGLTHIPEEAGAMIEAPSDEYSILTSKRFFRYQPGRVSAATFGVKLNRSPYTITDGESNGDAIRNPSIKKYGIFDKFDGYYFETKNDGYGDNFCVVRRTQSIIRENPLPFNELNTGQQEDYDWVGIPLIESTASTYPNASEILKANKRFLQEVAVNFNASDNNAFDGPDAGSGGSASQGSEDDKCRRDAGLIIEGLIHDLKYGGNATTVYNTLRFFNKTNPDNIQLFIDDSSREVERYNEIKTNIVSLLQGTAVAAVNSFSSYEAGSVVSLPGTASIETGATTQVEYLLNILITALTGTGNYTSIPTPVGSAAGEMCVYRDGLVMTHAAAHDPSLLKEKTNYDITELVKYGSYVYMKVKVPSQKDALQLGQGVYFNKNGNTTQNITASTSDVLKDGSIMYVYEIYNVVTDANGIYQEIRLSENPANEEIYTTVGGGDTAKASNPWSSGKAYMDPGIFDVSDQTLGSIGYGFTLQTPVPFVLPADLKQYSGNNYTDASLIAASPQFVDGSFPYLYPSGGSADSNSRGYIDSTLDGSAGISLIKQQFNYVNKRLFKNWIWFNVDPKYYKVYEYRVPRSRMSGEKLNGRTTEVVYSDNVLDAKAGDPVLEPATGEQIEVDSVWDLDPTKVTMYKIEFSWYGAVGATFLAYVPVSNSEARWVRVHHLRASNQLKVASLGNATLPITYMVYGGGSENRYGYKNADRQSNISSGYGSYSEQLVKYGASYYIDGGDRGTVRLFSHASDALKEIGGSKYLIVANDNSNLFNNSGANQESTIGSAYVNAPYLEIGTLNNAPAISDYYINAKVITSDLNDQDVRVVFADSANNRLYLSRPLSATTGNISLIVDRPQPLLGLKCRREINGIRNRVQIYPSRLSTGLTSSSESLVVQLIKSPIFQTLDVPNSGASISLNQQVNIGKRGKKVLLEPYVTETGGSYLNVGQKTYGYFRYTIVGDTSGTAYTTLGLLENTIDGYYFSAAEVTVGELNIVGKFLRAGHYSGPGDNSNNPDLSSTVESAGFTGFSSSPLSRLSAVNIDTEQRSPIPGTGTVITTLFSPNSGEEYDLQTYFDYNKDYLSFPLTDLVDSLYVCASSKSFYNGTDGTGTYGTKGNILASLTWEEQ